ncbi:dienelactone hydrolase family protein [Aquipuribacter nitratireducens]|uniref:Dienelactone hydrolase family protein n=1 Tax=Aquipuribacter nitratireducens TaxID=650104 RepID=A0ABW0GHE2_9MICO
MTHVLLFHHALGLTPGLLGFADTLRADGHEVTTPDLFDGRTFATVEEGVAFASEAGFGALTERGVRAADDLPDDLVYAGVSLGVMPAQQLAQTRAGARGALLLEAAVPTSEFGAWPVGLPVQVHGMDADPYFAEEDLPAARALVEEAGSAGELFLYPGGGHLFLDPSSPAYDATAAELATERIRGFLRALS